MHLLLHIRDLCIEFLFPRSSRVIELEQLSTDTLLQTLPGAEILEDRNTVALFNYSHPIVKEIVWEVKYRGNTKIAGKLGGILYDTIIHELADRSLFEKWGLSTSSGERLILMPIPISDKRRFERGWNQSEILAEAIHSYDSGKMFKYLPRQLAKLHHTESQTKTGSRSERLKNLKNSMKVLNESQVEGACVVVVDDVTTTGSTFREAERALHAAGAKKILCIALAH